ncbi:MAG TPA: methionyl-tRNA formyltransferase, partial [Thermoanaerobaculia bacterium]
MRILFFGDGAWAAKSLKRLSGPLWEIASVVVRCKPSDDTLVQAARARSLPVLRPENANAPEFLETVRSLRPDLNVSVSYDQIVRRPLLESAPMGFVNFHAGKLPFYRGRNVLNWALMNGEAELGLTAHFMDEGIDTGDIVLQRTLPIGWTDGYGDVLSRAVEAFPNLVEETLRSLAEGRVTRRPQVHLPGTYFAGRGPGDEWLDWSDTSRNLHNKIRAITRPGPGARTRLGEKSVLIWRAVWDPSWPMYLATPGQVVGRDRNEGVFVKTGDCTLLVMEVEETAGVVGRPRWPIGTRLGCQVTPALEALRAELETLK